MLNASQKLRNLADRLCQDVDRMSDQEVLEEGLIMDSLQVTDDAAKAVQKTPNRVSLESIENEIRSTEFLHPTAMAHMTIAVLIMRNGYAVIGKSAPADPKNYDEKLGKKFAREDAIRQIWPLEGYQLCSKLSLNIEWPADSE